MDTALGGVLGIAGERIGLDKLFKIKGITSGRNSFSAVFASGLTKLRNGVAHRMSLKVLGKGVISELIKDILPNTFSTLADRFFEDYDKVKVFVTDIYNNISQWIRVQIEMLNEMEESCDGEVTG